MHDRVGKKLARRRFVEPRLELPKPTAAQRDAAIQFFATAIADRAIEILQSKPGPSALEGNANRKPRNEK